METGYSDDYIYLEGNNFNFYYGYENIYCSKNKKFNCDLDKCNENHTWSFHAKLNGKEYNFSKDDLKNGGNMFDLHEMFLLGIGRIFELEVSK